MRDDKGALARRGARRAPPSRSRASTRSPRSASRSSCAPTRTRPARSPSSARGRDRELELAAQAKPDDARGPLQRDRAGQGQGAQDHPQDRRAGLARGDPGRASTPRQRRGEGPGHPRRRRRGHRVRRHAWPATYGALVVGFHVVADETARVKAKHLGVDIRIYRIIYELEDEVRAMLEGKLSPESARDDPRPRRGPPGLPLDEARQHRGLPRARRRDQARRDGAPRPRRQGRLGGHARLAAPREGRRPRGEGGLRVRHPPRGLRRHQGRRRHRGVPASSRSPAPSAGSDPPRAVRPRGRPARFRARGPEPLPCTSAASRSSCTSPTPQSLKDKRRIVRGLIDRVRERFQVAAAEVDDQDVWQTAVVGFACVSNDARHAARR